MNDETDWPESAEAKSDIAPKRSDPIRRERWYQRLKDWLWGYDFFISYQWASGGTYAVNLAARLREKGYEVFLDRTEYAMGDAWKRVGEVALRNTQRLVLIATSEAVFESKPVEHEIVLFTNRGRHCIPIFFGDTFAAEEQANPGKFIVLDRLPDDALYIEDTIENLLVGPAPEVIAKLASAHGVMRRRKLRTTITLMAVSVLIAFAIFASASWINALIAKGREAEARGVAEQQAFQANHELALNQLRGGVRDLEDGKADIGFLQLVDAYETAARLGERGESSLKEDAPLIESSRQLLSGWEPVVGNRILSERGVTNAGFVPGTERVFVCGGNRVDFWDARSLRRVGPALVHDRKVTGIAFSPGNEFIATCCEGHFLSERKEWNPPGSVYLWRFKDAQRLWKIEMAEGVYSTEFLSPQRLLVTQSNDHGSILVDADSSKHLATLPGRHVASPDGSKLFFWEKYAQLLDTASANIVAVAIPINGTVAAAVFAPDSKSVVVAFAHGAVNAFDGTTGERIGKVIYPELIHSEWPAWLVVAPDNATLLCGDHSHLQLWNLATGLPRGQLFKSPGSRDASLVHFSPDTKSLLVVGDDTLQIVDVDSAIPIWRKQPNVTGPFLLSHDEQFVVAGNHGRLTLIDANTGRICAAPLGGKHRSPALPPGDRLLLAHGGNPHLGTGYVTLWNLEKLRLHPGIPSNATTISPDGKRLFTHDAVVIGERGVGQLWNIDTGSTNGPPLYFRDDSLAAMFTSESGQTLITCTGTYDEPLWQRWSLDKQPPTATAFHSGKHDWNGSFSADLHTIATYGSNSIRVWNALTGELKSELPSDEMNVSDVSLSTDGTQVITSSGTAGNSVFQVKAWNSQNGHPIGNGITVESTSKHAKHVAAIAPDGKTVAIVDGIMLTLFDIATGKRCGGEITQFDVIRSVKFSPDSKTLLTGGDDGQFRLWTVPDCEPVGKPLEYEDHVFGVAFSPDGSGIVTFGGDIAADFWDVRSSLKRQPPLQVGARNVQFSVNGKRCVIYRTRVSNSYAYVYDLPRPATDSREAMRMQVESQIGQRWQGPMNYLEWENGRGELNVAASVSEEDAPFHEHWSMLAAYKAATDADYEYRSWTEPTPAQRDFALRQRVHLAEMYPDILLFQLGLARLHEFIARKGKSPEEVKRHGNAAANIYRRVITTASSGSVLRADVEAALRSCTAQVDAK